MKGKLKILLMAAFLLVAAWGKSQLLLGPTLSGGMTYGSNNIVDDTSRFYIGNGPAVYFGGGLDVLYQFNENIRAHVGLQYSQRQFLLSPPEPVEGLSFDQIRRNATAFSIPISFHYRIPLSEEKLYLNLIGGHSLDFTTEDSIVVKTPLMAIDSGGSWTRHEYHNIKARIPTVLLGVGMDFQMKNGSVLNSSLVWALSTGQVFKGNVSEWETLDGAFDPTLSEDELPDEFPDHYYDWSIRGSTMSLRVSYWFNLSKLFEKKDGGDDMESPIDEES